MKSFVLFTILALSSLQAKAIDATHGMVIFGKEKLYAYHLPMFHKVHNKQIIFTFDIPNEVKATILKAENSNYLTFVPAPFDLDKFIAAPFNLTGDLYVGHFEKNGTVILAGITLVNPKIIYLNELKKTLTHIENYKLLGTPTDTYALHIINGEEAIDQIFKLNPTFGNPDIIQDVISNNFLSNNKLLDLNSEYSISTLPGRCPSRLCGTPAKTIATFKTESLYFEDDVM